LYVIELILGGEEGARNGPSLMPGGPKEAFDLVAPIIRKAAAQVKRRVAVVVVVVVVVVVALAFCTFAGI